ncbi:nuclear transport factor 2 family protein [Dactylosporangium aurantiacum]|nr:nuclear transport factor 2 family protein [Dactylosporangium aurantiacum]
MQDYLKRYPQEIAFGDEDAGAVFDRYHTPGFVLHSDGLPLDRERLIAHARPARKRVASIGIDVHEVLDTGGRIAARYTLTAVMRKGATVTTEIFMFGELSDDGRLRRVDQMTRTV